MSAPRGGGSWSVIRGLAIGVLIALVVASCIVRRVVGPRLTGTCDGACAHYVSCKTGSTREDRRRCDAECPDVFADSDSLMAYESLECIDAVEFVDGTKKRTASKPEPASTPATIKR